MHPQKQRSKYICKPESVIEAGNHFVWEFCPGRGSLNVSKHNGSCLNFQLIIFIFYQIGSCWFSNSSSLSCLWIWWRWLYKITINCWSYCSQVFKSFDWTSWCYLWLFKRTMSTTRSATSSHKTSTYTKESP